VTMSQTGIPSAKLSRPAQVRFGTDEPVFKPSQEWVDRNIKAPLKQGHSDLNTRRVDEGIRAVNRAFEAAEMLGSNHPLVARALSLRGYGLLLAPKEETEEQRLSRNQRSEQALARADEIYSKLKDSEVGKDSFHEQLACYVWHGQALTRIGESDAARDTFERAIKYARSHQQEDTTLNGFAHRSLGELAQQVFEYDKAQEYYDKSIEIYKKKPVSWEYVGVCNVYIRLLETIAREDEAQRYRDLVEQLKKQLKKD
jgi:tetratricopeptide (TPR) repeat protein